MADECVTLADANRTNPVDVPYVNAMSNLAQACVMLA
jgi:hypothetical protein